MGQRIIDLDVVVPEAIGVRMDGQIYDLPGDIPVPTFLTISRLFDRSTETEDGAEAAEALGDLYEEILELFRVRQPDLESLPLGPRRLGALVIHIYTQAADADGEDDETARPPKPAKRAGTPSTSKRRKKKPATRSRSSS